MDKNFDDFKRSNNVLKNLPSLDIEEFKKFIQNLIDHFNNRFASPKSITTHSNAIYKNSPKNIRRNYVSYNLIRV